MIDRPISFLVLSIVLGAPFGLTLVRTSSALLNFVFFYPLFMSGIWMAGGLYFWLHWERKWNWRPYRPPQLPDEPLITILIPCYNEADNGEQTILAALGQDRKSVVSGKSASVRVDLGGRRSIQQKKRLTTLTYRKTSNTTNQP